MRLIMFGTGPFAVPTFVSLLGEQHQMLALVTRPIEDPGRRRKTPPNPMRDLAQAKGIAIFDPADVNRAEVVHQLNQHRADLFVVCDYGQILSRACLQAARLGGVNLHGSLLPKYRGAAPINWALYHGETNTGVTVIHMSTKMDAGPCLHSAQTDIRPTETAVELEGRLAQLGASVVRQAIELLSRWDGDSPIGQSQDPQAATAAPRLKKSDGLIDWERSAQQLVNQIRAFQPWPTSYTYLPSEEGRQLRLIIHQAEAVSIESDYQAGQVCQLSDKQMIVQTASGGLAIQRLQPAGKKAMLVADFLRGYPLRLGASLGPPSSAVQS